MCDSAGQQEGAWDRACRGHAGHGAPTRVRQGIPALGGAESRACPGEGAGNLLTPPSLRLTGEDNPPGAERGSAGARRWLRADGSGTSKVISSSNIAFLTHMVKSAWRQLGEVPVVTSV